MKYAIIILTVTLISCSTLHTEKTSQSDNELNQISDKKNNFKEEFYFDFDQVEHYSIEKDDKKLYSLYNKAAPTEMEEYYLNVLDGYEIKDTTFIDSLKMIGFVKYNVESSKNIQIKEMFKSRYLEQYMSTGCIAIYRDILVFKKASKTIGIAKICFSCYKSSIYGSAVSTESFGQSGEYHELLKLLVKQ